MGEGDPKLGRYTYARISAEIVEQLAARKRGAHARAADALGLKPADFSKRLNQIENARLTVEHIGLLADHLQAPPGWPFIPWKHAHDLEDAFQSRKKRG